MNSELVAIITGGSRGIGAATAKLLANKGYRICINYRSDKVAATAVVSELTSHGTTAIAVQADIGKDDDSVRLFEVVDQELGPVTALVNNAGILLPQMRVEDMKASRINQILETNVTGAFLCCRANSIPLKRGGTPEEVANAIFWLLSDEASYSTGSFIDLAGGR